MSTQTQSETTTQQTPSFPQWDRIKREAKTVKMPPQRLRILEKKQVEYFLQNPEKLKSVGLDSLRIFFRSLAFWDWEYWDKVICERWTIEKKTNEKFESADFHFELWEAFFMAIDTDAIIGRGQAKTTKVSKSATLYALCFEIEPSVLLIAPKGLGEQIIGDIRLELEENKFLKFLFGELAPKVVRADKSQKWRGRELQLVNRCEIKSLSRGEPVRGNRPTKIIIDDPQEDKDVKNPIIAQAFYNWIFTTVYPTLADGGSMFVLGTIISSICFVNLLKKQAKFKGFRVIEYPALLGFDHMKDIEYIQKEDHTEVVFKRGRPLWPQRWTLAKLAERAQKMMEDGNDIEKFLQEYCNIPFVLNGSPVFNKKLTFQILKPIRTYSNFDIQEFREIDPTKQYSLGIDFGKGKSKGDPSTIILRGLDFLLYRSFEGNVAQHVMCEVVDAIIEGFDSLNCIIVAENNIGDAFFNEAREKMWFDQLYKKVKVDQVTKVETEVLGWNTNIKSKTLMVNAMQKLYKTGNVEISTELEEQIRNYYHDENGGMNAIAPYHDDLVIADGLSIQGVLHGVVDNMPLFI